MRKDGQTDITKLIIAFRNFANAPKNSERTDTNLVGKWGASAWRMSDIVWFWYSYEKALKRNYLLMYFANAFRAILLISLALRSTHQRYKDTVAGQQCRQNAVLHQTSFGLVLCQIPAISQRNFTFCALHWHSTAELFLGAFAKLREERKDYKVR
jgi:hypothetical protein